MNPGFDIEPPDLSDATRLVSHAPRDLRDEAVIERVRIEGPGTPTAVRALSVYQSRVSGSVFARGVLPALRLTDCVLDEADLAGATCLDARFVRVALSGCRLTGFDARGADLRDVRFRECKAPDMSLAETTLNRVRFDACHMPDADLSGARIESLALRDCDARRLRLVDARIDLLDLRGSRIDGIVLDPLSAPRIVIDPLQSPAMVAAIGVRVLDPD